MDLILENINGWHVDIKTEKKKKLKCIIHRMANFEFICFNLICALHRSRSYPLSLFGFAANGKTNFGTHIKRMFFVIRRLFDTQFVLQ